MLCRCSSLGHLVVVEHFDLDPHNKNEMVFPSYIVCIRVGVILDISNSLSIQWACINAVGTSAPHASHFSHLLHHLNEASYGIDMQQCHRLKKLVDLDDLTL